MATTLLAATCTPRKLHALFFQGVHACVFPRVLSASGYMHLLAASKPARVTGSSAELAAACRSVGVFLEPSVDVAPGDLRDGSFPTGDLTLPLDPVGSAPFRSVRIPSARLQRQLLATRELLKPAKEEFVIGASEAGTSWVVDALALSCEVADVKTELMETLRKRKSTVLLDAPGLADFHGVLDSLEAGRRREVKQKVAKLIVDAPVLSLSLEEFRSFVAKNRSIWGERIVYRLRLAHTGSLALINSSFTKIIARAPGVKLRIGRASELLVRGSAVVVPRKAELTSGGFVQTGVAFRREAAEGDAAEGGFLFKGVVGEREVQKQRQTRRATVDKMRANWQTLKQVPIRLLRKRRGSKGQIYLTDKSQVSAFYRPRYFRSTGRKSRAVVRR